MNQILKIIPNEGVSSLRLGLTQEECLGVLGVEADCFKRTPDSEEIITDYPREYMHVVFNKERKASAYIIFTPRMVELFGVQLLGRSPGEVYSDLVAKGVRISRIEVGFSCDELGVSLVEAEGLIDGVEISKIRA